MLFLIYMLLLLLLFKILFNDERFSRKRFFLTSKIDIIIIIKIINTMDQKNNNNNIQDPTDTADNETARTEPQSNLSLQQIKTQFKEKAKECKTLQAKNKKLQSKYIELFKQQKLLKKDWAVLTSIIKIIFPNLQQKTLGKYDTEELNQLWILKEGSFKQKINQLIDESTKNKQRMQRQIQELTEEKIQKIQRQCKQKVQAIHKQLQSFKKNNKNLAEQIIDLDKKIDSKSQQISKLTKQKLKLEHRLNQLKVKSITDQLSDQNNVQEQKSTVDRNQFLAVRQQVDDLMLQRDQLRSLLKNAKTAIDKLKLNISEKNNQIQKLLCEKSEVSRISLTQEEPKMQQKISISSSDDASKLDEKEDIVHHLVGDDEYVHRQYVKNVFKRYMKSLYHGDQSQTQILLNIILTILKFNTRQKQEVKEKRKGWFGLY